MKDVRSDEGFLARWSRRKSGRERGGETTPPASIPAPDRVEPAGASPARPAAAAAASTAAPAAASPPEGATPAPTLDDVARLTPESDYSRFVAPDLDPQVRNAALKKLFADPHFNAMDGLDIYIDDYGRPDPLPRSMLGQLVQSRALGLLAEEPADPRRDAAAPPPSVATAPPPSLPPAADEDPDLRLQPNDAPGHAVDRPRAAEDSGGEC